MPFFHVIFQLFRPKWQTCSSIVIHLCMCDCLSCRDVVLHCTVLQPKKKGEKKRRKFPTDKASTYSLENETDPFYVTIFNFENFMIACKINSFSYQKISINGTR